LTGRMALRATVVGSFLVAVDSYATTPDPQQPGVCKGIDISQQVTVALEPFWGDYSSDCVGNECSTGVVQPLVDEVCTAAGLNCARVVVPWSNIWDGDIGAGFTDGSFQIAAAAGNTGPRGDKCMHFSNPYTKPGKGFVLATPAIAAAAPAKGSEVKFCALKGWAIGTSYLEEAAAHQMEWMDAGRGVFSMGYTMTIEDMYETGPDLVAAHEAGECHYSLIMEGSVAGEPGMKLVVVEEVPVEDHRVGGVSFMVDGKSQIAKCLVSKLNEGIDAVRASGFLASVSDGLDVNPIELQATFENPEGCVRM